MVEQESTVIGPEQAASTVKKPLSTHHSLAQTRDHRHRSFQSNTKAVSASKNCHTGDHEVEAEPTTHEVESKRRNSKHMLDLTHNYDPSRTSVKEPT